MVQAKEGRVSDEDFRLSILDKVMITLCSLALVLIFGTALALISLIYLLYGPPWIGLFR